eukprot:GHRR01006466.1.p1 GENE.GHRR01006466.1~~GHRR01006466.1.p1  ORF type:complete len:227 (+),score=53.50 GHRR01006466.1:515-1195(+)
MLRVRLHTTSCFNKYVQLGPLTARSRHGAVCPKCASGCYSAWTRWPSFLASLQVPSMQKFRKGVPEKSSVYICKNSLMREAVKNVPGWEIIVEKGCQGDNAWVFVHEDDIPDTVKHWHAFSDGLAREAKAAAPKGVEPAPPTTLSCVVMDNKYLSPAEFKRCENLPTKKQLQATIARLLKQPATKIASGIKAVPRKLAYGIKAISELDEDQTKIVGDVVKPKANEA